MARRMIAFGWYGGKYSHLRWLLPLLPYSGVRHFGDVYGGSAVVLLNREPSPVETYNDLNGEIVNFFRVLRSSKGELMEKIGLTPFSLEEFRVALRRGEEGISDLERARRFFVRVRQTRNACVHVATERQWAFCRLASRAGMAGNVSRWLGGIEGLSEVAQRLLRVQIDCVPALEILERYDSPQTLFYCDPPYAHGARSSGHTKVYAHEMTDKDHTELAAVLHGIKGRAAISGYHCELMDELYGDWNFVQYSKKAPSTRTRPDKEAITRVEVLWANYPLP